MVKIVVGTLLVLWLWIAYEIHIAPEVDDDGNVISKTKKK